MELVLDSLTKDTVLVSVVDGDARFKLEITKDPTQRDGNLGYFYVTAFVKIDFTEQDFSEMTCPKYVAYENEVGRHPYLVQGERVVSLNTGISEFDNVPIAVGSDYARIYHYPYEGSPIHYRDGSYELTIANKRLTIIHGVTDFLYHKITTLSEEEVKRPVYPQPEWFEQNKEELTKISNIFKRSLG